MLVCCLKICVVIVCYLFYRRIDEQVEGVGEEGNFVEHEEDQRQFAEQGKPPLEHITVLLHAYVILLS
jgi:phytoene/squalene synthetase